MKPVFFVERRLDARSRAAGSEARAADVGGLLLSVYLQP